MILTYTSLLNKICTLRTLRCALSRCVPSIVHFVLICAMLGVGYGVIHPPRATACSATFSLPNVKLKDHTLFAYQDFYYLASIRIDLPAADDRGEYTFAYARTSDFCTWEDLGTILGPGAAGDADESYIWAPHVVQDGDTFYMFYTGVNQHIAQSIMLATSTNPADPQSWVKQGVVFRPNHEGMVYPGPDHWADARDPMVFRYNDRYYLYYTGRDTSGGIIGVAMADTLAGPWLDLGATMPMLSDGIPESPFVVAHQNYYYLFYNAINAVGVGQQVWRWGPSPFGPWQAIQPVQAGWAHDFYLSDSTWYVSFVVGEGEAIKVDRLYWDMSTQPPTPQISYRAFLPLALGVQAGD